MPQAKNHLTASTQAKNGSLYAVIQYKDENGNQYNGKYLCAPGQERKRHQCGNHQRAVR